MTEDWNQLNAELTRRLGLSVPPVAITFTDRTPPSPPPFDAPMSDPTPDGRTGRVPASCSFWVEAVDKAFVTTSADHGNCSVGRFVHGLAGAEEVIDNEDIGALVSSGWVTPDAFEMITVVERKPAAIVYEPLDRTSDPDLVLLRLNPKQMMELSDAAGEVELSGKPQCQVIAKAGQGRIAVSMGCALSRARTGIGDDELTCAVPAAELAPIVARLTQVNEADAAVRSYAADDAGRFAGNGAGD